MKKLLILVAFMAILSTQAGPLFQFYWTDTDLNEWKAIKNPAVVYSPSQICTNTCNKVGTNNRTNSAGVWFYISNGYLYTNGVASVPLISSNGDHLPASGYFGWDIDHQDNGWLMCQANESDPDYYLFEVDLGNGYCLYYSKVGPWDCGAPIGCRQNNINGMYIHQYP
jgi:hypothetical protein